MSYPPSRTDMMGMLKAYFLIITSVIHLKSSSSRLIEDKILSSDWIKKYSNKSNLDARYVNKLLGILALEIWYRLFITKDLNPNEKLII